MDMASMIHNAHFCLESKSLGEYENQIARLLDELVF